MPQTVNRPDHPAVAGFNKEKLRRVEEILEQAIRDSVFPGAQLAVVRNGILVMNRSFGYHTYEKKQPVRNADVYDVASLTKILATTPAIMRLLADGKLRLTDPVSKFFPEWKTGKKKEVTLRHLLEHNSGLPAFRPYVDEMKSPETLRRAIINEPLVEEPGKKTLYSDLGFMILGWIVEQVSGEKLNEYVQKRIWQPAGMTSTTFLPLQTMQNKAGKPIPTERDTVWRKKLIVGEVHDERAWAMGGISGHAGVFTNAGDVAAFASMLQNKGLYAGQNILPETIVKQFTERKGRKDQRLLGFDVKKETNSAAGTKMSHKTFGHTGFTGTSVWMDPESGVSIILLTNRVHPFRSYGGTIQSVRGAVADAVMESLVE
jgi:CubicO group peptidase (beta-lactamase class C family)